MDIAANILEIAASSGDGASGGAKKTHMMYRALLSYPQLGEYLELLTSGGLLVYLKDEKVYQITEKGRHFLKISKEMESMIPRDKPAKAVVP